MRDKVRLRKISVAVWHVTASVTGYVIFNARTEVTGHYLLELLRRSDSLEFVHAPLFLSQVKRERAVAERSVANRLQRKFTLN